MTARRFGVVGFLLCLSVLEGAFAQHGLTGYPVGDSPDPRLVLLRRTVGKDTYLCSSGFVDLKLNGEASSYLVSAGHCAPPNQPEAKFTYWTQYIHTAKVDAKHSKEGSFTPEAVKHWDEPDVSVTELPESALLDATPIKLANETPEKGQTVKILAFPGASRGGFGPYAIECKSHGIALFVGNTGVDEKQHGRIAQELICPWVVSPDGISGSPVVNEAGEYVGTVNSAINTGNGFLSADTVVIHSRRSKSFFYYTPVTRTHIQNGKLELTQEDGPHEVKNADNTVMTYTLRNGKVDGHVHQTFETGEVMETDVRDGILHGDRKVFVNGTEAVSKHYEDGVRTK